MKKGVLLATLLPGIFYIFIAMIFHSWMALALFVLAYSSMQIQHPIFVDYLNRHIENRNRATTLSLINVFSGIYIALMGLLIGWIADFSLSYAFAFMSMIIMISAIFIRIEEYHVK